MTAIEISIEGLAAMLAEAYRDGWERGHDMIPHDPQETFIMYHDVVEDMCTEEVRH